MKKDLLRANMKVGWVFQVQLVVMLMIVMSCQAGDDESHVTLTSDHLTVSFKMENKTVKLEFVRNEYIPQLTSYYTSENDKLVKKSVGEGEEMYAYVNHTTEDTIIVNRYLQNGSTVTGFIGNFNFEKRPFSLVTMDVEKALNFDDEFKVRSLGPNAHRLNVSISNSMHIIEPEANDEVGMDFDSEDFTLSPKRKKRSVRSRRETSRKGTFRQGLLRRHYVVDYFVVVDYSIYSWWYNSTGSEELAIRNIQHFYSQIVNGIDLRYSSIENPAFAIDVKLVGLYVATSPSGSPWTEHSDLKRIVGGKPYTDLGKALMTLSVYVQTNSEVFGSADHVSLFTANHLCGRPFSSDGSCPKTTIGASLFKGVCHAGRKISVNREFGVYGTVQTGAHELGHSLGARHDGDGVVCSTDDQFVMAIRPQVLNDKNFNNPYQFSPCSIDAFRQHIEMLDSQDRNCMTTNVPSTSTALTSPSEQLLSVDEQCHQLLSDRSSFYCSWLLVGKREAICKQMKCWNTTKNACVAKAEQRAYEKTTCGNNKWCIQGECVHDVNAPSAFFDFPVKTYNAALKRPAFQSSVFRRFVPRWANDGNLSTKFLKRCSHTKIETNPWWAVDLGRPIVVYRVDLTNRRDSWGKRSRNFVVGLTNASPAVSRPTLWNYTLCGQYPGIVPNGGTVSLHCRDNLPGFRYVIVQIPRQDALNVCEIQVHVRVDSRVKTYNAALNRPAFQSSVWQNGDRKAPAHLANDGNFATTFRRYDRSVPVAQCSASTKETNPWWAVDLGRPMAVYRVDLTNRGDGAAHRANNFVVGLTDVSPLVIWPTLRNYTMCGQYPGAVPAGATVSVYCEDNPPPSRYVIVQFPINDIMTVCEIQVHVREEDLKTMEKGQSSQPS